MLSSEGAVPRRRPRPVEADADHLGIWSSARSHLPVLTLQAFVATSTFTFESGNAGVALGVDAVGKVDGDVGPVSDRLDARA